MIEERGDEVDCTPVPALVQIYRAQPIADADSVLAALRDEAWGGGAVAAPSGPLRSVGSRPRNDDLDLPLSIRLARWVALAQGTIGILGLGSVFILGLLVTGDFGGMAVLALFLLVGAGMIVPVAVLVFALMLAGLDSAVRTALIGLELLMLTIGVLATVTVPGAGILCLPIAAAPAIVTACLLMPAARRAVASDCDDESYSDKDAAEGGDRVLVGSPSRASGGDELACDPTLHDLVTYWKGLFSGR